MSLFIILEYLNFDIQLRINVCESNELDGWQILEARQIKIPHWLELSNSQYNPIPKTSK